MKEMTEIEKAEAAVKVLKLLEECSENDKIHILHIAEKTINPRYN